MSFDLASSYLSHKGYGDRIKVFEQSMLQWNWLQ